MEEDALSKNAGQHRFRIICLYVSIPNQAQNKRKFIAFPKPLNKKGQ